MELDKSIKANTSPENYRALQKVKQNIQILQSSTRMKLNFLNDFQKTLER